MLFFDAFVHIVMIYSVIIAIIKLHRRGDT